MSTGDIKNNLRKLKYELKQVGYIAEMDIENMNLGIPISFLPILHYIVSDYSRELSSFFSYKGYDFCGKTDLRFIEVLYKLLIQEFNMKPMLTKQQFFAIGYAEMKIIFVTKIINQFFKKNDEILMKLGHRKKHLTYKKMKKHKENNSGRNDEERETENKDITEDLSSRFEEKESLTVPSIHQSPTLPKPIPELCLTPLKSPAKPTSNTKSNEFNESIMSPTDYENVEHFIESRGKDMLDVSFNEGMESSEKEITQEHIKKPHFQITKHILPVLPKIIENDVEFNIGFSDENMVELRSTQESVTSICKDCQENTGKLYQMEKRIKQLEDNFTKIMTINTDLSAKVILLETKVAILENEKDNQSMEKDICEGAVSEKDRLGQSIANLSPKTKRMPLQQVDNFVLPTSTSNKLGMQRSQYSQDETIKENQSKIYSSLDYTDDDVIIESFKPISMKDVHKMMLHDSVGSGVLHGSTRFERQYDISNIDEKENHKNLQKVENNGFSNVSNISVFSDYMDEEAKNTVYSVRQKLLETKLLLNKT